jgi:hypothetical protein
MAERLELRRPIPLMKDEDESLIAPCAIAVVELADEVYVVAFYAGRALAKVATWHDDGSTEVGQRVISPTFVGPQEPLNEQIACYLVYNDGGVLQGAANASAQSLRGAHDLHTAEPDEVARCLAMQVLATLREAVVH